MYSLFLYLLINLKFLIPLVFIFKLVRHYLVDHLRSNCVLFVLVHEQVVLECTLSSIDLILNLLCLEQISSSFEVLDE